MAAIRSRSHRRSADDRDARALGRPTVFRPRSFFPRHNEKSTGIIERGERSTSAPQQGGLEMRSMRCDACGNKALMAASQCPSCGHLFEVRDGFGKLLPLAFCSACDSFYPAHVGSCKWCGTTPAPPPNTPRIWKTAGAVALVVMIVAVWLLRGSEKTPSTKVAQQGDPVAAPQTVAATPAPTPVVAVAPPTDVAAPTVSDTTPPPATASVNVRAPSSRWVTTVARDWAIVRAGPSKETRIVASVGPGARVQLGESQGTWRRIRARGIAGWVEPHTAFAAAVPSSARAREFVSR
jgi:hypothetical protein